MYSTHYQTPTNQLSHGSQVTRGSTQAPEDAEYLNDEGSEIGPVTEGLDRQSYSIPSDSDSETNSPRHGPMTIRRNDPYTLARPQQFQRAPPIPGVAHQPLIGRCDFIFWPILKSTSRSTTPPESPLPEENSVSLTQVKFEMTPAQVRWILWRLANVIATRVVATGSGSFRAAFQTRADAVAATKASKRVIFDHHGMWSPSNSAQQRDFAAYHQSNEFRMRSQRLPREFMRVTFTSSPASASAPSTPEVRSPAGLSGGQNPPRNPPAYTITPGGLLSPRA